MRVATVRQNLEARDACSKICSMRKCIDYTFSLDYLVMRNGDKKEEDID